MKNMKKIALVLALVMAFVTLTACAGSKGPEGTWKVTNMTGDAFDLGVEGLDVEQLFASGLITITLTFDNGKLTMAMSALGETETQESTYTVKGDKIVIEDTELTFKISGSKLTLEGDGNVMTMERQK